MRPLSAVGLASAEGIVESVAIDAAGVRCVVRLKDYLQHGEPMEAVCRLLSPVAGPGHGTWHVPAVGTDVLCIFPGVGPNGVQGDDLDRGWILGFPSNTTDPPPDGQVDPLSATRRVEKGQAGESLDRHIQGDLDSQIDGDQTETVDGNRDQTVGGNDDQAIGGDQTIDVTGAIDVDAGTAITIDAQTTLAIAAQLTAALTATGVLTLDGLTVQIGGGAYQLVDSRLVAVFNALLAQLDGEGALGGGYVSNHQIAVATHTTTKTFAG